MEIPNDDVGLFTAKVERENWEYIFWLFDGAISTTVIIISILPGSPYG